MAQAATKTSTSTLETGSKAPDFTLPTDGNGEARLSSFQGKKNVVLYFYPKDDTPGCTTESKGFRDAIAQFEALDTVIFGISKDSVASHDKFKTKHCLPFSLLSDAEDSVCEAYGVWGEKNMYGKKFMGITRATFLIGKDGTLQRIWPKVKVAGHVQEVLEAVQAL